MTPGILGYWEGNQVGALAEGKSVCLGYTKAYAYLVQCMHPEIYTNNGNYEDASDWKAAKDLYYDENENLSIDKDYAVDVVRISFETDVTMYGETQPGFNSDHFWNAVKVGGQWYYVDPVSYTHLDVYKRQVPEHVVLLLAAEKIGAALICRDGTLEESVVAIQNSKSPVLFAHTYLSQAEEDRFRAETQLARIVTLSPYASADRSKMPEHITAYIDSLQMCIRDSDNAVGGDIRHQLRGSPLQDGVDCFQNPHGGLLKGLDHLAGGDGEGPGPVSYTHL